MFDAREYLESLELPMFVAPNGAQYVGRLLSIEEWQPFETRMRALADQQLDPTGMVALMRDITNAFFPRGHRFWQRSVWDHVKRLPAPGQLRAIWSFQRSQAKALGVDLPALTPGTMRLLGETPPDDSHSAGS